MNRRRLLSGFLVMVSLAILWGVAGQRGRLADLRAERQRLVDQMAAREGNLASPGTTQTASTGSATEPASLVPTPELLQLRSEVTRLTERRRELGDVRADTERLHARIAARGTNGAGGFQLPPGYVRKSEARMVGYDTPEDALQTLLWATRNHDLTNVLQAFAPGTAEWLRVRAGDSQQSMEDFLGQAAAFVGMRIVRREQNTNDGSMTVEVEVIPGDSGPRISFRQINGQWKIAEPF